MSSERWGAFSVIDHTNPATLTPDVLLYDRLVFPVPTSDFDKTRWEKQGWQPQKQAKLVDDLGDLAVSADWSSQDQLKWADLYKRLQFDTEEIVKEAGNELSYQATRMVLAQKKYPLPVGVNGIDVIAASRSEQEFRRRFDVDLKEVPHVVSNFGLKLRQRIAVPFSERKPEHALTSAIQLAREDREFRNKRTRVYELQNRVLSTPDPPRESVQELEQATQELVDYIGLMVKPVKFTNTFAIVGIQPGAALGLPFPGYNSPSITISGLQFRSSVPGLTRPGGTSAPTAMYHE